MSKESLEKAREAKQLKKMSEERQEEISVILYEDPKVYFLYKKVIDKYARKLISQDMTFIEQEDESRLESVNSRMICVIGDNKFMRILNSATKKYLADYKLHYSIPYDGIVLFVMHKIYKVIK